MYQTIVLGLGLLILLGGGYLIKNMDSAGVLTSVISTKQTTDVTVIGNASSSAQQNIEGTYLCSVDSGCPNPSLLTITNNGEAILSTTYGDGVETLRESGIWKGAKNGGVNILLTGTDTGAYDMSHILSVRYVSAFSLSGIKFNPNFYKDWTRPVFRKQDNGNE